MRPMAPSAFNTEDGVVVAVFAAAMLAIIFDALHAKAGWGP